MASSTPIICNEDEIELTLSQPGVSPPDTRKRKYSHRSGEKVEKEILERVHKRQREKEQLELENTNLRVMIADLQEKRKALHAENSQMKFITTGYAENLNPRMKRLEQLNDRLRSIQEKLFRELNDTIEAAVVLESKRARLNYELAMSM